VTARAGHAEKASPPQEGGLDATSGALLQGCQIGNAAVAEVVIETPRRRSNLGADKGGRGGGRKAQGEQHGDRRTVEQALDGGELRERHDKVP